MSGVHNIPKHWEAKTLGEVCQIQTGKYDANHAKPSGKFRFYTCAFEHMFCDTNRFKGENLILPGNGANVGEVFYYNGDFDAYQRTYVLNGIKTLPKYLYYNLLCNWKKQNQDKQFGSATNYIRMANFTDYIVPVPPPHEQQAIVSKIEELLSELENGKQQLQIAQQQLKVYRQSLLKWAFEGKMTNKNVKEGELPEGWKWVKTGEIIDTINNGYTPTKEYLFEGCGEIPFIKVYNLNFDGSLNFKKNPTFIPKEIHKKKLLRSVCIPGDVLINIVGPPLGKVSIVTSQYNEWNINQAIVLFRPNENIISKYISYYLQNPVTIHWLENTSKATAGQWNVKVSTCREIPIPIPPIEEQKSIVDELECKLTVCDKIEETINQSLQQVETLRQSILKKAFEGKLTN